MYALQLTSVSSINASMLLGELIEGKEDKMEVCLSQGNDDGKNCDSLHQIYIQKKGEI